MLNHLRPQYAKTFRCIGADCEDTCCQGWDVVIDRDAYGKLQSIPSFKPRVDEHIVIIPNPTDADYARIQLTPSCACPFLSEERLCSIQQVYGEHYLPDICANYPRSTQRIDGLKETALLVACPEAARIVLLNPDLVQPEEPNLPRYHRFLHWADHPVRANGSPHQFLWDIRAFSLLLLRDREYPLWQRLFLLGMFCKRLHEVTSAQQIELVPQLLKEHSEMIAEGKLRSSMDGIPTRTALQLGTILEIINHHLETTAGKHPRFRECVKDFLAGIHCGPGIHIETCAPVCEENQARYCAPFLQKHPYMLENYLLNHVFRTRFPYGLDPQGKANDPLTEFLTMCVLYALIRSLLVGISGHYREAFATEHVVKVVQSVAKSVEQCPKFPISRYMSLANADGMALLLRVTAD